MHKDIKPSLIPLQKNISEFNSFVLKAMEKSQIPGLAIAVVEDGKNIVFAKGFGVTDLDLGIPVTVETQFGIGSVTKPLTSLLIAKLVDEGRLDWSSKIIDLYPNFMLEDKDFAQSVTLANLLSHTTGISRKDLPMVFFSNQNQSPEELLFRDLKAMTASEKINAKFLYNNQLYSAAGFIAAFAQNKSLRMNESYQDLMIKNIFEPLKMTRTSFKPIDNNHAAQHASSMVLENKVVSVGGAMDNSSLKYSFPSGGVWSSVMDMANYIRFELQSKDKNVLLRRKPKIQFDDPFSWISYGFGLMIMDKNNLTQVGHDGGTFGFSSMMSFLPEQNCGVVILCNLMYAKALGIIASKLFELWFNINENADASLDALESALSAQSAKVQDSVIEPNSFFDNFLGRHQNQELGIFEIIKKENAYYLLVLNNEWLILPFVENDEYKFLGATPPLNNLILQLFLNEDGSFYLKEYNGYSYIFKKITNS